jgi:trehalose-6-phosphatase
MMNGSADDLVDRLASASSLLVVCEFDGTIAEFAPHPPAARPVEGALDILTALGSLPRTRAAIISGRSLESLRAVCDRHGENFAVCHIELIGSDGMEIASHMNLGLTADARRARRRLFQAAAQVADEYAGVTVDEKPYGVALHVRGATKVDATRAIERLLDVARSMPSRIYSQSRSEVLDIRVLPVGQDWAIDALRHADNATVFYAGNDERALASLNPPDVGVQVGSGSTGATFCIEDPVDLVQLLVNLVNKRAPLVVHPS